MNETPNTLARRRFQNFNDDELMEMYLSLKCTHTHAAEQADNQGIDACDRIGFVAQRDVIYQVLIEIESENFIRLEVHAGGIPMLNYITLGKAETLCQN